MAGTQWRRVTLSRGDRRCSTMEAPGGWKRHVPFARRSHRGRRLCVGTRRRMPAAGHLLWTGQVSVTCAARTSASPPIGWPGPHAAGTRARTGSRTIMGSGPLNGVRSDILGRVIEMPRSTYVVLCVLVVTAGIVIVDLLFFRHQFLERLIVNIGIVLVVAAFYLRFLKNP